MLDRKPILIADLRLHELVPGGVVALDHSGAWLAFEVAQGIMVADPPRFERRIPIATEVTSLRVLAMHAGAGLVATGAADGLITLFWTGKKDARWEAPTGIRSLTALAFSTNGKLLAVGCDDGLVILLQVSTGKEITRFNSHAKIRALALGGSGYPMLIGDASGRVIVCRRVLPPLEIAGTGDSVTALALVPHANQAIVGWADSTIGHVRIFYRPIAPYLLAGMERIRARRSNPPGLVMPLDLIKADADGPRAAPRVKTDAGLVRALARGPGKQVTFLTGNDQLYSFSRRTQYSGNDTGPSPPDGGDARGVWGWWLELRPLVAHFATQRQQMRTSITTSHRLMLDELDELDGLDEETRNNVRKDILASVVSVHDSSAFNRVVKKIFSMNPLPWLIAGFVVVCLGLTVFLSLPVQGVWHLRGLGARLVMSGIVFAIVLAGAGVMHQLRRYGAAGRAGRAAVMAVGMTAAIFGRRISIYFHPSAAGAVITRWFPWADHQRVRVSMPYPIWVGVVCLMLFLLAAGAGLCALRFVRIPEQPRDHRKVRGAVLLHALLDVAFQARRMAGDRELADSPEAIRCLFRCVRRAESIARREWVSAMRIGLRRADRLIRDQGRPIAEEIRRCETRAALAGAELPALSRDFATMMVKAVSQGWLSLGSDPTASLGRRRSRGLAVIRQVLALTVPLAAAAAILIDVRPLPTALVPLFTLLVGISIARVLRWLDASSDIEAALKIAEDLRKS